MKLCPLLKQLKIILTKEKNRLVNVTFSLMIVMLLCSLQRESEGIDKEAMMSLVL